MSHQSRVPSSGSDSDSNIDSSSSSESDGSGSGRFQSTLRTGPVRQKKSIFSRNTFDSWKFYWGVNFYLQSW